MPLSFFRKMVTTPKKYPAEARDRAVRMVLDRLFEYPSIYAACKALAPKLDVGPESLRRWVLQAQVDTGEKDGPTTTELDELKQLRAENRDLKEANEILKAASIFLSSGNSTLAAANQPIYRRITSRRSCVRVNLHRPARAGRADCRTNLPGLKKTVAGPAPR